MGRWLDRFPTWATRRGRIVARVRRHASSMILASRFLPGLRVAIPAACACAGVRPLRFSSLSLVSSFLWAAAVMAFVSWLGPASLHELGGSGWWTALVPAALVVGFGWWLGREATAGDAR
jgi:membrane protein DedA with SNARE-associated domain